MRYTGKTIMGVPIFVDESRDGEAVIIIGTHERPPPYHLVPKGVSQSDDGVTTITFEWRLGPERVRE